MLDRHQLPGEGTMSDTTSDTNLYVPGLSGLYRSLVPYGYPVIRFGAGAILIYHGWAKLFLGFAPFVAEHILTPMGFPAPLAWTYFLGILECLGGAAIAIGLFTRPIALMLTVEMAIITFGWAWQFGYFFTNKGGGYEYPLLMLIVFAGILMRGSDRCSIDRMVGREF
jgi:putative oxidoreductase